MQPRSPSPQSVRSAALSDTERKVVVDARDQSVSTFEWAASLFNQLKSALICINIEAFRPFRTTTYLQSRF